MGKSRWRVVRTANCMVKDMYGGGERGPRSARCEHIQLGSVTQSGLASGSK